MRRRSAALSIGALLLFALMVVALLVYPVTEKDRRPAERAFAIGDADDYRITAGITVDGETALAVDGAVVKTGERRVRIVEGDVTTERYRDGAEEPVYTRLVLEEGGERRLEELESNPDRAVLESEWDDGTLTVVTVTDEPDSAPDPTGAAAVVATELRVVAYDRAAASGERGSRVLRPQGGWYDGRRSYRVTEPTGEVTIDPPTDVLHSADVRWELTPGTPTYAHYLLNRDETATEEISYRYRTGNVSVDRPGWVDSAWNGTKPE